MSAPAARVEALFHAAVERPPGEWAAFVCAQTRDLAVRAEVLSLLAHDRGCEAAASAADAGPDLPPGSRVGAYRVSALLGWGGMGRVFRARREDDGAPDVALKLLRPGLDGAHLARFAREWRLLARLAHPGIAAFVEAGRDPLHGPYVVMEFVDGVSLGDHCAARGLDLEQRLGLFAEVCDAVQAAHACGVVHRDLKPSNVLVTRAGRPKLIDFGVATSAPGGVPLTRATATGHPAPLTPGYASPEQYAGGEPTPACDVFALGVLLGELAAGPGYVTARLQGLSPSQAGPGPGSRRERRRWRGLDDLVAAATRLDPAARPASAALLAREARRLAAGRRPSGRLAPEGARRRRRVGALAAAALLALATAAGARWARPEAAATGAPPIFEPWVAEVDERLASAGGTLELRAVTLQDFTRRLGQLFDVARTDGELRRALATSHERLASVQGHPRRSNLGRPDVAEAHYRQAVALRLDAARSRLDPRVAGDLVDALTAYGTLRLDAFHDLAEARRALQEAARLGSELHAREHSSATAVSLVRACVRLADVAVRQGRSAEALRRLEAAERARLGLREPPSPYLMVKLSGAVARRGQIQALSGDPEAGVRLLRTERVESACLGAEVGAGRHPNAFDIALADALGNPRVPNLGRTGEALALYRELRLAYEREAREDPEDALVRAALVGLRLRQGQTLAQRSPHAALRLAYQVLGELGAERDDRGESLVNRAGAHDLAAEALAALGALEAAWAEARRAVQTLAVLRRQSDDVPALQARAEAHERAGHLEARLRRFDDARASLERALDPAARLFALDPSPASSLRLARLHWRLARLAPRPDPQRLELARRVLRAAQGACSGSTLREREGLERDLARASAGA